MTSYMFRRLVASVLILLGIVTFVFFMMHLLPGDPASVMLGFRATEERVKNLREELGLNDPIWTQYSRYVSNIFKGDFGRSMSKHMPVSSLIIERIPATVELAVA